MAKVYRSLLVTLAICAIIVLVSTGQSWATVTLTEANSPGLTFSFSGRDLEPIIAGLTIVPVAGVIGLMAAKGLLQRIFGFAIFLIGSVIGYLSFAVTQNWQQYVSTVLGNKLGRTTTEFTFVTSPIAPATILPAVGIAVIGLLFTFKNFDLAKKRPNYESGSGAAGGLTPWQALDSGIDPTISIMDGGTGAN